MDNRITLEYSNGRKEECYVDEKLEILRIDIFTFIFDKEVEVLTVYAGEENLEFMDELDCKKLSTEVCLEYIKNNVSLVATRSWKICK